MATVYKQEFGLRKLFANQSFSPAALIIVSMVFVGTLQIWLAKSPLQNSKLEIKTNSQGKNKRIPYQMGFIPDSFAEYTHAVSTTALDNGDLLATWYSGTREGGKDVNIYLARFDSTERRWLKKQVIMTRALSAQGLQRNIKKIGNPVISKAPNGRLWLFFVTVSIGGWAGSAINVMYSDDDSQSWSTPKRLVTTPFFNLSTLEMPQIFDRFLLILSGLALPMGLLLIGASISFALLRQWLPQAVLVAFFKLFLLPAAGLLLFRLAGVDAQTFAPGLILLAAPTATLTYVMAREMGGHVDLAVASISLTTILSAFSYALWLGLLN